MDWKERLRANAEGATKQAEQNSAERHAAFMTVVREAFAEFKEELAKLDGYSGDFDTGESQASFRINNGRASAKFTIHIGKGGEPLYVFSMDRADGNANEGGWRSAPNKDKILGEMADLITFLDRT